MRTMRVKATKSDRRRVGGGPNMRLTVRVIWALCMVVVVAPSSATRVGLWEGTKLRATAEKFEYCDISCLHGGTPIKENCKCECPGRWGGITCGTCMQHCLNGGRLLWDTCVCECLTPFVGIHCETCPRICKNGKLHEDSCVCDCGDTHWEGLNCDVCGRVCKRGTLNKETCECQECGGNWGGPHCDDCMITECEVEGQGLDAAACECVRMEHRKETKVPSEEEAKEKEEDEGADGGSGTEKLDDAKKEVSVLKDQVETMEHTIAELKQKDANLQGIAGEPVDGQAPSPQDDKAIEAAADNPAGEEEAEAGM